MEKAFTRSASELERCSSYSRQISSALFSNSSGISLGNGIQGCMSYLKGNGIELDYKKLKRIYKTDPVLGSIFGSQALFILRVLEQRLRLDRAVLCVWLSSVDLQESLLHKKTPQRENSKQRGKKAKRRRRVPPQNLPGLRVGFYIKDPYGK